MAKVKTKPRKIPEKSLWEYADKLHRTEAYSEYKHIVTRLIFIKFISDQFKSHKQELIDDGKKALVEKAKFYKIFHKPEESLWYTLVRAAIPKDITLRIDTTLNTIEKNGRTMRCVLPDYYFTPRGLELQNLGSLFSLINNINDINIVSNPDESIGGMLYECFLWQFAASQDKSGDEFYTPRCKLNFIDEMIESNSVKIHDKERVCTMSLSGLKVVIA